MLAALHARLARARRRAVTVRPARPADAPAVQAFVRGLSPLARRRRFLGAIAELSPAQLDRLIRPQDPRDLALVALAAHAGEPRIVAMAQYALDEPEAAEFAVAVADAWHGQGLGQRLLEALLAHAAAAGVRVMGGFVLADNRPMLALAAKLGFRCAPDRDPDLVRLEKPLSSPRRRSWLAAQLRQLVAPPAFAVQVPW